MKRVLIIHGWESNSKEHWFQEAKTRLERIGYQVTVPDMPDTFFPKQEEWVKVIEDFRPDENSILIGHSLGGPTILRYLERTERLVGFCIFIASPVFDPGYPEVSNFFQKKFDWQKIKKSVKKNFLLYQTKDPWVPIEHGHKLSEYLDVKIKLVKGDDHFDKIDFSLIDPFTWKV